MSGFFRQRFRSGLQTALKKGSLNKVFGTGAPLTAALSIDLTGATIVSLYQSSNHL